MLRLVIRRLLLAIPLIVLVSLFTFVLLDLAPGDPASTLLGPYATADEVAKMRQQLGLDLPLWQQYWDWLSAALHGDFGKSAITGLPVLPDLMKRLPVTLSLVIGSTLVSTALGVTLGMVSAVRGRFLGRIVDVVGMVGIAIPNFWLALILVKLFAVDLGWVSATGYVPLLQSPEGWFKSIVVPVVTLSIVGLAGIAKQTRDSVQTELSREYVDTFRALGMPEREILLRHVLRNSAIPVLTMVGIYFTAVLGGSVLVENASGLPGVGSFVVTSTNNGDLPVVQAVAVVFCCFVVLANLLVDLAYGWLNPKVRVTA